MPTKLSKEAKNHAKKLIQSRISHLVVEVEALKMVQGKRMGSGQFEAFVVLRRSEADCD